MASSRCTCGSEIPENAQFCPGCGRPLTPEALAKERAENAFPVARESESREEAPPVSFGNAQAVRSCYWAGVFAALISSLPLMALLSFIVYPAAGFFSVASFRKRSGRTASVREGARLGWMTGVIAFALSMLLLAIEALMPGAPSLGERLGEVQKQLEAADQIEAAEQLARLLGDPAALTAVFLIGLIFAFAWTAGLCLAGGALAGKALSKD